MPLGGFRTWVKYVEKGTFPDTRRYFSVLRCNHCDDAPCVTICPTVALYRRSDGIVDFDTRRCIGCKSCMQACPYDALYIDPDTNTAAKCHYCAHRIEVGLEPACVVVCPEQRHHRRRPRRPAHRDRAAGRPRERRGAQGRAGDAAQGLLRRRRLLDADAAAAAARPRRISGRSARREEADLTAHGRRAVQDARPGRRWHAEPRPSTTCRTPCGRGAGGSSAYLWTKSIAAGALLVAALLGLGLVGRAAHDRSPRPSAWPSCC